MHSVLNTSSHCRGIQFTPNRFARTVLGSYPSQDDFDFGKSADTVEKLSHQVQQWLKLNRNRTLTEILIENSTVFNDWESQVELLKLDTAKIFNMTIRQWFVMVVCNNTRSIAAQEMSERACMTRGSITQRSGYLSLETIFGLPASKKYNTRAEFDKNSKYKQPCVEMEKMLTVLFERSSAEEYDVLFRSWSVDNLFDFCCGEHSRRINVLIYGI